MKVSFYNPFLVTRVVELLQNGAVMNKTYQPYESHIPYIQQFFIDYNLYGMNLLNASSFVFRLPVQLKQASITPACVGVQEVHTPTIPSPYGDTDSPKHGLWTDETVPRHYLHDPDVERLSTCELEVDVKAQHILNQFEIGTSIGTNPGLLAIWEDERQRREDENDISSLGPPISQDRGDIPLLEAERKYKEQLRQIVAERDLMIQGERQHSMTLSQSQPVLLKKEESSTTALEFESPIVDESIIQEVVESSQRLSSQELVNNTDMEMIEILASLAGDSSQSRSSSQSILADPGGHDNQCEIEEISKEEDEESILMSQQVWDDTDPANSNCLSTNDLGQDAENKANLLESQCRFSQFDFEGLDETWEVSLLSQDQIPQLDGTNDDLHEDSSFRTNTSSKVENDKNTLRKGKKPLHYSKSKHCGSYCQEDNGKSNVKRKPTRCLGMSAMRLTKRIKRSDTNISSGTTVITEKSKTSLPLSTTITLTKHKSDAMTDSPFRLYFSDYSTSGEDEGIKGHQGSSSNVEKSVDSTSMQSTSVPVADDGNMDKLNIKITHVNDLKIPQIRVEEKQKSPRVVTKEGKRYTNIRRPTVSQCKDWRITPSKVEINPEDKSSTKSRELGKSYQDIKRMVFAEYKVFSNNTLKIRNSTKGSSSKAREMSSIKRKNIIKPPDQNKKLTIQEHHRQTDLKPCGNISKNSLALETSSSLYPEVSSQHSIDVSEPRTRDVNSAGVILSKTLGETLSDKPDMEEKGIHYMEQVDLSSKHTISPSQDKGVQNQIYSLSSHSQLRINPIKDLKVVLNDIANSKVNRHMFEAALERWESNASKLKSTSSTNTQSCIPSSLETSDLTSSRRKTSCKRSSTKFKVPREPPKRTRYGVLDVTVRTSPPPKGTPPPTHGYKTSTKPSPKRNILTQIRKSPLSDVHSSVTEIDKLLDNLSSCFSSSCDKSSSGKPNKEQIGRKTSPSSIIKERGPIKERDPIKEDIGHPCSEKTNLHSDSGDGFLLRGESIAFCDASNKTNSSGKDSKPLDTPVLPSLNQEPKSERLNTDIPCMTNKPSRLSLKLRPKSSKALEYPEKDDLNQSNSKDDQSKEQAGDGRTPLLSSCIDSPSILDEVEPKDCNSSFNNAAQGVSEEDHLIYCDKVPQSSYCMLTAGRMASRSMSKEVLNDEEVTLVPCSHDDNTQSSLTKVPCDDAINGSRHLTNVLQTNDDISKESSDVTQSVEPFKATSLRRTNIHETDKSSTNECQTLLQHGGERDLHCTLMDSNFDLFNSALYNMSFMSPERCEDIPCSPPEPCTPSDIPNDALAPCEENIPSVDDALEQYEAGKANADSHETSIPAVIRELANNCYEDSGHRFDSLVDSDELVVGMSQFDEGAADTRPLKNIEGQQCEQTYCHSRNSSSEATVNITCTTVSEQEGGASQSNLKCSLTKGMPLGHSTNTIKNRLPLEHLGFGIARESFSDPQNDTYKEYDQGNNTREYSACHPSNNQRVNQISSLNTLHQYCMQLEQTKMALMGVTQEELPMVETEKPLPMVETEKPLPMVETEKPLSMVETEKPLPMVETEKPLPMVETEKPLPMVETEKPLPMVKTEKPLPMVETERPLPMVETEKPLSMVETERPLPMVETEKALPMVETEKPLPMVETEKALPMVETEKPLSMVETEKPLSMVKTEKPLPMVETEKPLSMVKTEKPLPMVETEKPLPMIETEKPLSMVKTEKPLPMVETEKPLPMVETEKPLPMVETEKPLPGGTSLSNESVQEKRMSDDVTHGGIYPPTNPRQCLQSANESDICSNKLSQEDLSLAHEVIYASPPVKDIRSQFSSHQGFVIMPKRKAPSSAELTESLVKHGIPMYRYQKPFYGDPHDVPENTMDVGGRVLKVQSKEVKNFMEFDTRSPFVGLQDWRQLLVTNHDASFLNACQENIGTTESFLSGINNNYPLRMIFMGDKCVTITPCRLPPNPSTVRIWAVEKLQEKMKNHNDKNSNEDVRPDEDHSHSNQSCTETTNIKTEPTEQEDNFDLAVEHNSNGNQDACDGQSSFDDIPCSGQVTHVSTSTPKDISYNQPEITSPDSLFSPVERAFHFEGMLQSKRDHVENNNEEGRQHRESYHENSPSDNLDSNKDNPVDFQGSASLHKLTVPFQSTPIIPNKAKVQHATSPPNTNTPAANRNLPQLPLLTPIMASVQQRSLSREKSIDSCYLGSGETHTDSRRRLIPTQFKLATPNVPLRRCLTEAGSDIEGPSPVNTAGYKVPHLNIQEAKASHEVQHLTLLSIELHIRTRKDRRPDPEYDPICALFYHIQWDSPPLEDKNKITGIICVDKESAKLSNTLSESWCHSAEISPDNSKHGGTTLGASSTSSVHWKRPLLTRSGVSQYHVQYVEEEKELFQALLFLVRKWDPDILIGYEVQMLSWGYLIHRALAFDLDLGKLLSRVTGSSSGSNIDAEKDQWGASHTSELKIGGRIILNVWRLLRHEVALNIYTFENVVFHILHERIPLYTFRSLSDWWDHKTDLHRWRTVQHYVTRCRGNIRLLEHVDFIGRTSELARLFGILFYCVISRGSQFRVESMMLRMLRPLKYLAMSPSVQQRNSMNAPEVIPLVLEPESRFYSSPVLVLDFQSLYPSMIIAYNYCYSTCLGRLSCLEDFGKFKFGASTLLMPPTLLKGLEDDIHISPNGIAFIKSSVRRGVLPKMLEDILNTRIMVKNSMKKWKNKKAVYRMLDARQLGLKLIANVTYGYTAAHYSGRMPCVEIGDSIVRKARETLEHAIHVVNTTSKWDAKVVYGDTDSMFVLLDGVSKDEAFRIGQEIADTVTAMNPKPVKLKFEKTRVSLVEKIKVKVYANEDESVADIQVYLPCILQTKKRYVGYMYETADQKEPVFDAKGIETVRRDTCPAVAKVLEKSLRLIFETKDVSLVKRYVQRQFCKVMEGRVSLHDLTFAKEYRGMASYKPGACVPSLELTRRMLKEDHRSEPRVGERVPYVIVYGSPGLPLIRLVRRPHEVLQDPSLRINALYYINKQLIPPLNRAFLLMGVDVKTWFAEVPRNVRVKVQPLSCSDTRKKTISHYFATTTCPVCQQTTSKDLCDNCANNPQKVTVTINHQLREHERKHQHLSQICYQCCGSRNTKLCCVSLDCPVFHKLVKAKQHLNSSQQLRRILTNHCTEDIL